MTVTAELIGAPVDRLEGREKVTGAARYAYEYEPQGVLYAAIAQATVGKGEVVSMDIDGAMRMPGVRAVLWHANAPRLHEASGELAVLQSSRVSYRGQIAAVVVADSLEEASEAARLLAIDYAPERHDAFLRPDHPGFYRPEKVNPGYDSDAEQGDFEAAFAAAEVTIDCTYTTPAEHNNPMEPHATVAAWEEGELTVYDSTQGSWNAAQVVAGAFGLPVERVHVISPHVGGGFGSKGTPRPQVILAVMAAQVAGRPVKLAVTRQQMFSLTGYRTPTIQRLRLGATRDGRLTALGHDVWEQTSTVSEFAEQTAVCTRMMYAGENRRTTHRLTRLDVPTPSWMRAPGECPGMYALESAVDELAAACGLDPIELRIRNEPEFDPETGRRFSSRGLVACLREGASRFGWQERGPRREGDWLIGAGVAASTYPARRRPSQATARAGEDGSFLIRIAAADIGTGARTALAQVAADALEVPLAAVQIEIGSSDLPQAWLAGGSMGLTSWSAAVIKACRELRARLVTEEPPLQVHADTTAEVEADEPLARHSFGAQFVEVAVDAATGEIRVPRALGVFAAGRIINAKTARSQFIGGMTMGIGMALHEESLIDREFGDYANHDFATYHVPACADIEELDAIWIEEHDPHVGPAGAKGIGEIGIVGTAAAVANAVSLATGVRFRDLPLRPDRVLAGLSDPAARA